MSQPSKNSKTRGSTPQRKERVTASSQSRRFVNFAREIETDEFEEHFDAALRKVAAHKPSKGSEDGALKGKAKQPKGGQ